MIKDKEGKLFEDRRKSERRKEIKKVKDERRKTVRRAADKEKK